MIRMLLVVLTMTVSVAVRAQLLTWTPDFPVENNASQTLSITVDATKGNQGLLNYTPTTDVYVHIGVITNYSTSFSDWKHVVSTWGTTTPAFNAVSTGTNKWTFTITGSLRTFFGITDPNETIQKIAILFRNGSGNKKQTNTDGSDMYIPVYSSNLAVRIKTPPFQPTYLPVAEPQTWVIGTNVSVTAAANKPSAMKLYYNGTQIATAAGVQSISGNFTVNAIGNQRIIAEANDGTTTKYDTLNVFVAGTSPIAALPNGVKDGINYESGDTSVTLVLRAPGKGYVTVIGDFNNWTQTALMNKTPDGKFFWQRITGLTSGTEYGFQYKVDDTLRIADPYAEKILDPNNDQYIPAATYPNLKPYPAGQSGMVGVLQTAQPGYSWTVNSFTKPDKKGLVIYELLIRDFVAAHDWKTLRDTLNYIKKMGFNAIEVMPFNEFEGNISWGYNPDFYFAPDKYYGPKNTLKSFVDSCHKNGIAVIMDIVLNHTYGPSPLALLYWDPVNHRPANNNIWYNAVAPHWLTFGDDFNHASADTKYFFDRVLAHWVTEYKIDGYRLDYSKGLTQTPSNSDATSSAYDASRINIITSYATSLWTVDPTAYMILEHFCDNTEEKQLADNGMLLWSSVWNPYEEAAMGYIPNSNFDNVIHLVRGWTKPHLVGYDESHDQERIVYKNINFGNTSGSYNIKDTATALKRMELDAAFLLTVPGPKMVWQFGELGYDYSINYCQNGTINSNCRVDPKPIRWDYLNDPRRTSVRNVYTKLNQLRFHPWYKDAFMNGVADRSLTGSFKWLKVTTGNDTSDVVVIGNFDVIPVTGSVSFPTVATWYDYFANTTLQSTGAPQSFTLQPGEYHVYVNRNVNNVTTTGISPVAAANNELDAAVFPNPASGYFTLELNVPQTGTVTIELIDALGQKAGVLRNTVLPRGVQQIPLNRKLLPNANGVYYLRVTTKTAQKTITLSLQ